MKQSVKNMEAQWQAESDAETMARYQEIIGDKKRMSAAIKIAQKKAADLEKRATAMKNVYSKGGKINLKKK